MTDSINYKDAENYLPYFIDGIEEILDKWTKHEATHSFMRLRGLEYDAMVNFIGIRILTYTFDIIEQTESLKFCPYADQLVEYFDKNGMKINEIFLIYMDLNAEVREYLFEKIPASKLEIHSIVQNFSIIFEYNLSTVLEIYFNLQLSKIATEQQNVLKEKKILDDYKEIVDESSGVVVCDNDGIITYTNERFCSFSGYSNQWFLGRTFRAIHHDDNQSELFSDMWNTISNKHIWSGIIKNKNKNGATFYVDATVAPLLDHHGEIIEYISLQRNITQMIEQEEQLKKLRIHEENLRLENIKNQGIIKLIHTIPLPAFLLDSNNIIHHANNHFFTAIQSIDEIELCTLLDAKKLSFASLLEKSSQIKFKSYPQYWVSLYTSLYNESLIAKLNNISYRIKLTPLEESEFQALILLEVILEDI